MIQRHVPALLRAMPDALQRHILHFESQTENAVARFANSLQSDSRVLDAGAGESQYAGLFKRHRYTAVDLAVGDSEWTYGSLDAIADLQALPFAGARFEAAINIVTLEHVREPALVIAELGRVLKTGGRLLLVTPHEWEEHQQPYDYFRYTRFGLEYLLTRAGFIEVEIEAVGGFFRLLGRRLLNAIQFFPGPFAWVAAVVCVPVGMLIPIFDKLDRKRNFTLGHICTARKAS
ncbi:MAG: class I SAM-dependent methyltransferase [Bryobacteraceae bacterium]